MSVIGWLGLIGLISLGQAQQPLPPVPPDAPLLPPTSSTARVDIDAPTAERPAAAAGTVAEIKVKGLKRVDEAAILAAIGLRVGEQLADWKVQRDVKAVYNTGYVDDVRVDITPTSGGIRVLFLVDEKPAVRAVRLDGNKKLDEESLLEVIDIKPFSVLSEVSIQNNMRRIKDKYIEKGYYLAEIEPELREVDEDLVELTFSITENRKVIVQRIDITGNDNIPDRKVRRFMQTKEGGIAPWLTSSGNFNQDIIETDVQIIKQVFLEEGYYDAQVSPPQVFLSPDKRYIYINIHVEEGPRYKLGAIEVDGDYVPEEGLTEAAIREIIDNGTTARIMNERFKNAQGKVDEGEPLPEGWENRGGGPLDFRPTGPPLKTGDFFRLSVLQQSIQQISDLYGDQGYAFANVLPVPTPRPDAGVIDVVFRIQKGDKVRIGRIDITGNDPTYDKVIRREIPINEGDVYSGSALNEARMRLDRLGYFESVRLTTPRGASPDVLDMKVEVVEQPTGSFSVGAGFSNLESFIFTTNISKNNFLGLGYVMSLAANISRARQQGNLQLFDPYFLDSRWTLRINGYSISRQFIEDEYQRGGSIAIGRYLDKRNDMRMEFDYTFEDTGLNNLDTYKERLLGGQLYRNGLTSTGGLSFVVDKRNNRINATRGVFLTASANLSGGFRVNEEEVLSIFGGDFNFYELRANLRLYRPLAKEDRVVFKYNGTIGHIGTTDGTILPFIHRYRAGGINSVRGYDWYTLGPALRANGTKFNSRTTFVGLDDPTAPDDRLIIGGTETWINNFEIEAPIVRQAGISAVVFFDAGNAFGDVWGEGLINPAQLRLAYGFGIRWFSPMGPLRFEYGIPINPRPDERPAVFDFSIGSLF
ncbi:MAG: outer membrane protein assembly factor BamA [Myxococcota bacterium]